MYIYMCVYTMYLYVYRVVNIYMYIFWYIMQIMCTLSWILQDIFFRYSSQPSVIRQVHYNTIVY